MSENNTTVKELGQKGRYSVQTIARTLVMFPKVKQFDPKKGKVVEKSIKITRCWKEVLCKMGDTTVTFSHYTHQGKDRWKDSRDKTGRFTPTTVVKEMSRMLRIDENEAVSLLSFGE
jgi:hypothetical protein